MDKIDMDISFKSLVISCIDTNYIYQSDSKGIKEFLSPFYEFIVTKKRHFPNDRNVTPIKHLKISF